MHATTRYKGQRNLAKGDIAWVIISCRYLPSYSPSGSRPHEVGLARCTNLQRLWRSETGEKGGCGGQRSYRSKERWPFPVGSPLWSLTIALSRPFSHNLPFECLRRSNQQGHFRAKRMEERLKDVRQILKHCGEDTELSYTKENLSISFAVWALCTNVTNIQLHQWTVWHRSQLAKLLVSDISPNNVM